MMCNISRTDKQQFTKLLSFSKALKDLPSHQSRYKGIHSSDLGTAHGELHMDCRAEARFRQLTPIAAQCSCAIAWGDSRKFCALFSTQMHLFLEEIEWKLCISLYCVLCDISSSIVATRVKHISTEGKSSAFQPSMQQGFLEANEYFSNLKSAVPSACLQNAAL